MNTQKLLRKKALAKDIVMFLKSNLFDLQKRYTTYLLISAIVREKACLALIFKYVVCEF